MPKTHGNTVGKPGFEPGLSPAILVLSVILANEINLSDVCWLAEQVLIGKESGKCMTLYLWRSKSEIP